MMIHSPSTTSGEMLIQSSLPISIREPLFFVSNCGTQHNSDMLCGWSHHGEIWNQTPKCDECPWDGCRKSVSTREEEKDNFANTGPVMHPGHCPHLPFTKAMSASSESRRNNFVYQRRKQQKAGDGFISRESSEWPSPGGQVQNHLPDLQREQEVSGKDLLDNERGPQDTDVHHIQANGPRSLEVITKSNSINEDSVEKETITYVRKSALEYCSSTNDHRCSSKSNVDYHVKNEADYTGECSSSDIVVAELLHKRSTDREICISPQPWASEDGIMAIDGDDSSYFLSCKICGILDNRLKMLICDLCEEAFHLSCCNPKVKSITIDEWHCQPCTKKNPKPLLEVTKKGKSFNIMREMSEYRKKLRVGSSQISLMLKDGEPYTSAVRIGKAFQAEVPEWSGPLPDDSDTPGEALEVDPAEYATLRAWVSDESSRKNSIGNWIQCREVIYKNTKDGPKEVICGKWRRAPLFEVQTDNWDCSCSVLWDPVHADCAVPQELGTDEVLNHLKYVQLVCLLRPRLTGTKRKLEHSKCNGSE